MEYYKVIDFIHFKIYSSRNLIVKVGRMAQQEITLQSFVPKLRDWLLKNQDPSGGWGEHAGGRPSTFNTAEAILALCVAAPVDGVPDVRPKIRKAVEFLTNELHGPSMEGPDCGAWCRSNHVNGKVHKVADIVRTATITHALIRAGESADALIVENAIKWLIARQNSTANDSGWAYQRGGPANLLPTCFVLLTLIGASANEINEYKNAVERGLAHLTDRFRNADGSFGSGALTAPHTLYACLVLQAARGRGFGVPDFAEKDAIKWLLNHQDDLSPIEEKIEIDPSGIVNYRFMFSMEALLLRVLGSSADDGHRKTRLWLEIQRSLRSNYDEGVGGFYGQRVFSWSTAHGLYAIKVTEGNLKEIPPRPEEGSVAQGEESIAQKHGPIGHAILFLSLVLIGANVYLTVIGKFTPLTAMFLGILVVACLLAYDKIGEQTFKELFPQLLKGVKKES